MGDISTHAEIFARAVGPVLRQGLGLGPADILCFELGNWLRDVSQFRDPPSLHAAKIAKYRAPPAIGAVAVRRQLAMARLGVSLRTSTDSSTTSARGFCIVS